MKNQITIFAGILIILAVCIIGIPAAGASPQLPCEFFGTVTISGSPAQSGTEISAYVNNVKQGSIKVKETGVYGGVGTFDERLIVLSGENDFSDGVPMIVFKIGDKVADQSTQYTPGTSTELALTTGGTPVVVTPSPATEEPVTAMQAESGVVPTPVTPLMTAAPATGDVQAMAVQTLLNQTIPQAPVIPVPTTASPVPVQEVTVPVVPVATAAPVAQVSSIPVVLPTQPAPVQTAMAPVVPAVTTAPVPQITASMMSTPTPVTGITGPLPGNVTSQSIIPNQTMTPVVTPVIPVVPTMTVVPSPTPVPELNGTPQTTVVPAVNQTTTVQANVSNSTMNQTPVPTTVTVSFPSGQTVTQ